MKTTAVVVLPLLLLLLRGETVVSSAWVQTLTGMAPTYLPVRGKSPRGWVVFCTIFVFVVYAFVAAVAAGYVARVWLFVGLRSRRFLDTQTAGCLTTRSAT